jgi:hypothetical protein
MPKRLTQKKNLLDDGIESKKMMIDAAGYDFF